MFIWHFDIDGGSFPDWIQAIGALILVFLTIRYGKAALGQLGTMQAAARQSQQDSEQTLKLFQTENRPYLGIPLIRPEIVHGAGPKADDDVVLLHYLIVVKNYGHLPAKLRVVSALLDGEPVNVVPDLIIIFPGIERELTTMIMPAKTDGLRFTRTLKVRVEYSDGDGLGYWYETERQVSEKGYQMVYERTS